MQLELDPDASETLSGLLDQHRQRPTIEIPRSDLEEAIMILGLVGDGVLTGDHAQGAHRCARKLKAAQEWSFA